MAGILDKKSRIFDYIITSNGKKQIQKNDTRFKYATLSDRSIIYNSDDLNSGSLFENISNSEYFYLPLEPSYNTNSNIIDEFSFEEEYENKFIIKNNQLSINDALFDSSILEKINENISGYKITNLNNLLTKNLLFENTNIDFKKNEINKFDFKNLSNVKRYSSIIKYEENCSKIKPVSHDNRFKHKTNFKKLLPIDNNTKQEIFQRDLFTNLESENNSIILKSIVKNLNLDNLNRQQSINKIINYLENSNMFFVNKYELKDQTDHDSFILEMHEVSNIDDNEINISKLSFIDMGEIFDSNKNITKRIFLIGKLIKTKNSTGEVFDNTMFQNNNGILDKTAINNILLLGSYYSFINMFTLIID